MLYGTFLRTDQHGATAGRTSSAPPGWRPHDGSGWGVIAVIARYPAALYTPRWKAHEFTPEEQRKLQAFESYSCQAPNSVRHRQSLLAGPEPSAVREWLFMGLLGLLTAVLCAVVKQSLQAVMLLKENMVATITQLPAPGNQRFLVLMICMMALNVFLVAIASLLVVLFAPQAAGSGIPEVFAAFNGVELPDVFNLRTLSVKVLSLVFAVCSGLPVGVQGPMIHIGAQVGHLLSTAPLWPTDDTRRRAKFRIAGVATGVSAVFAAPIGGLLLVMEAMSSWWDTSTGSVMILFSCLACLFVSQLLEGSFIGFRPTENMGYMGATHATENHAFHLRVQGLVVAPAALLGAVCGLLSAVYIMAIVAFARLRVRVIGTSRPKKVAEACVLALVFTVLSVGLPRFVPCVPAKGMPGMDATWLGAFCTEQDSYNPLATLSMHGGRENLDRLFSTKFHRPYGLPVLLTYLLLYFSFATVTAGAAISCGTIVPSLTIGAVTGRIFGIVFSGLLVALGYSNDLVHPAVFAYVGAGAFLAGSMRLTFSMVAIMVELSGDTSHLFSLMVAIYVSNLVANHFTHSLAQSLLAVRCVPMLEDASAMPPQLDCLTVAHTMARPVVTVERVVTQTRLRALLRTTHGAFPVVDARGDLVGLIGRHRLRHLAAQHTDDGSTYADRPKSVAAISLLLDETPLMRRKAHSVLPPDGSSAPSLDLTPWLDASPFTVQVDFAMRPALSLFRQLGLRHLIVLEGRRVVGILTRKDLLPQVLEAHLRALKKAPVWSLSPAAVT